MGYSVQEIGKYQDWAPTATGFSAAFAWTRARYTLSGKMCTCEFNMTGQTSNATTFTMTLPFAASSLGSAAPTISNGIATDNSAAQSTPVRIDLAQGSNIATIYKSPAATAWTASGAKACRFVLTYEIQ